MVRLLSAIYRVYAYITDTRILIPSGKRVYIRLYLYGASGRARANEMMLMSNSIVIIK